METDSRSVRGKSINLGDEVTGYRVEGTDGTIGKLEHVTYDQSCLVVRTGRLRGGTHVVPAFVVERVDDAGGQVFVTLSQQDVKDAPEYDSQRGYDEDCQTRAEAYYGRLLANREFEREREIF